MGLFSALSGKTYHYNSINTPIDNELADRIRELDVSAEKAILAMFFDITQKNVQGIFNPDTGIMKEHIQGMDRIRLKRIWNILIIYLLWHTLEDRQGTAKRKKLIKQATLVLGIDEHKMDIYFIPFKEKPYPEQLIALWNLICVQIGPDLDNYDNLTIFADMYAEIYNNAISKYK